MQTLDDLPGLGLPTPVEVGQRQSMVYTQWRFSAKAHKQSALYPKPEVLGVTAQFLYWDRQYGVRGGHRGAKGDRQDTGGRFALGRGD